MLHAAFTECHSPVGIVFAHRRVDVETTRQFGINYYVIFTFQRLGKVLFYTHAVEHYQVVKRFLRFNGIDAQLASQSIHRKDVGRELIIQLLVSNTLDNSKSLAVIDNQTGLDDKFLRVANMLLISNKISINKKKQIYFFSIFLY